MHYPWFYVPGLTAPMIIAIVAVVHVLVAHYAVGGGILLALENRHSLRTKNEKYRSYWKKHVRFFVLLTVVFGAITGVGIWWTIGLASPLATELLIRTFVFGWAIEWVFFILEIIAAFGFYYFWDQMKPRAHIFMGWIYAFSAWISLVLITGITAFMLNSQSLLSDWANQENGILGQTGFLCRAGFTQEFWLAFVNVQFFPQMILRTGAALVLATFYVYLHASIVEKDAEIRGKIVRRMRLPSIFGIFFIVLGSIGWFWFLPESSRMMLERAAAMNIFLAIFIATLFGMTLLLIIGPFKSPKKMSAGFATALLLFGIVGISTGEFLREAVRKPFVVDQKVYGNQVYVDEIKRFQCDGGILYEGIWTKLYLNKLQEKYPELNISADRFSYEKYKFPNQKTIKENLIKEESTAEPLTNEPLTNEPLSNELSIKELRSDELSVVENQLFEELKLTSSPKESIRLTQGLLLSGENSILIQTSNQNQNLNSNQNINATQNSIPIFQPISTNNLAETSGATGQDDLDLNSPKPLEVLSDYSQAETPQPLTSIEAQSLTDQDNNPNQIMERILSRKGNPDLLKVSEEDRIALGEVIFVHHCNDCHAAKCGYSAVGPLLTGKLKPEIIDLVQHLNRPGFYMPPWLGSEVEAELLADYLLTIRTEMPKNVIQ
ncbi:MAG: cytochrome ubiquinol oxidase subunit I [Planctomycetia bacterium]|nr:cytochrome ubiquinol oxidase subunit I [Planctomycetia bacterium]